MPQKILAFSSLLVETYEIHLVQFPEHRVTVEDEKGKLLLKLMKQRPNPSREVSKTVHLRLTTSWEKKQTRRPM